MIRFRCKECGKTLKAAEEIIGRQVKCTRCASIETVPESDNLAKPKQPKNRLAANKPKPTLFKSAPGSGAPKTVNLDQPVELFGHSAVGSTSTQHFEPRFNVVTRKEFNLRRWVLFGLIGVFAVAVIAVVFNLGWIMDVRRRFSTDYENLEEVVFYRNNVLRLEKSRRMMYIAGRNYILARLGTEEEAKELEDYNASIEALTKDPEFIKKVEGLYRRGEDAQARALLINTAQEMKSRSAEVDRKTNQYIRMAKGP